MRTFESGATRDDDDSKLDYEGFLSPLVLKRFAEYMHQHRVQADGSFRASDNWQKGIPPEQYMKSLLRHVMDLWLTHRSYPTSTLSQDTCCAIMFNVMGYLHERLAAQVTQKDPHPDGGPCFAPRASGHPSQYTAPSWWSQQS